MFIKPKREKSKPKQPKQEMSKPSPQYPEYVRTKQMAQIGLEHLSRDYVIEHNRLIILSWDYVTEHGKEFGYELWWDPCNGWFIYDDEEDENYTGLSYELYQGGNLMYYAYIKDGLAEGLKVRFYPSGELKSFGIYHKRKTVEIFYEWYESGKIRRHFDGSRWFHLDEEGYILKPAEKQ